MRALIFTLLLGVFLAPVAKRLSAQPNTLYLLNGVPQTKELNPSRPGIEKGYYLSLPFLSNLDLNYQTNGLRYSDLIHRGSGSRIDSLVWDFKNLIGSAGYYNAIGESAAISIFEFGIRYKSVFYAFSWSEREFAEVFFSGELLEMLYGGNASRLGSTFHSGYFGVNAQHYREFAFTLSRDVSKKTRVGITGKLLFGLSSIRTTGLNVVAAMPEEGDLIGLGANGQVNISAPVEIRIVNDHGYQVQSRNYFEKGSYLTNFGNPGLSVDLGFRTKISSQAEFSASIVDLGFISWKKDLTTLTENSHYTFRGVNLDTPTETNHPPATTDVKGLFMAMSDTLRAAFYPAKTADSFMTLLPVKMYVAASSRLSENLVLGGVARMLLFNSRISTSLTTSFQAMLSKKVSVAASYSILGRTVDNLGLAATFRFGATQIYAASDNLFALSNPATARNMNLRVGMNLIFKDHPVARKKTFRGRRLK